MKFEGREIDDQVIAACRQRMMESEFERRDLLAIIRSFRLPPDLAERIAENLIHDATVNNEIVEKEGHDHSTWIPQSKKSPGRKTSSDRAKPANTTKPKRKPRLPSPQLDLFAES